MADTLRSLAGDRFKTVDVISALHTPLTPEQAVLDRHVFLPHARTGIAAALTAPFDWKLPNRATVEMRVPVIDDRDQLDAEMTVHVYGPADVTEIDPRQVIRTFPQADAVDVEVDDLTHVEFDRPDLPWLFTPTGPDGQGRLVPWITLVVAESRFVEWGQRRGATREARIRRDQLQPLGDAWAWAHAQVAGAMPDAETEPTLERRLSESNAAHNLSRLVCPRRLDDRTAYVACVVPTFLAGVRAGLGQTPGTTLEPSWGASGNFAGGDPLDMITLPVYFSWSFGTGEEGNFESLARKLRTAVAPPGVGRRRVDATRPWAELALEPGDPGAEIVVTGPVVSPKSPESAPEQGWPSEARQRWDPPVTAALAERLNRADEQAHTPDPGPPLVGPPLYGGPHARQTRVETQAPTDATQPQWFRDLNLDPRHRIVAGLGTRVVQAEQEDLMLAAWNQVAGLDTANRTLRLAQLAKHVGASLHRRHLARLSDAAVVSITERVHAKVLDTPQRSAWAAIRSSSLPLTTIDGAFRRLARIRGPVVRAAGSAVQPVEALTVGVDRLTTDWVLRYTSPDGITELSDAAADLLTDAMAAQIAPGTDRGALIARWRDALTGPAPSDRLNPGDLSHIDVPDMVDLGRGIVASLAGRLTRSSPTEGEMAANRESALSGASHATLLRVAAETAVQAGTREIEVSRVDAERLRLDVLGAAQDPARVLVSAETVQSFAARALELVRKSGVDIPFGELEQSGARLRALVGGSMRIEGRTVVSGLVAIGAKAVWDDPFAEAARGRVDVPALELVRRLNPAITVPARISARLTSGSGRLPNWVRSGWFDDLRIEPVMAHPRFRYPMYEPLHRYDRDWMIPGLGLIERPDMVTLLETNNRFIEAYLVGLNHEMARELLWREYPTDQRGTYFSSFWTGAPELVADMHELPWRGGALGAHVDQDLDGRLVLLVRGDLIRRYPGVVAHAVRQAGEENGIPTFEAEIPISTLFHVHLPPNVLLVGFAMTKERIETPGETWWFTLSENPTEPRFGLDPSRDEPLSRDSLSWSDFGVPQGGFLDATRNTNHIFDGSRWGASSAEVAHLLFQLPARAAFLGKSMVEGATD